MSAAVQARYLFDLGNTRVKWAPMVEAGVGRVHAVANDIDAVVAALPSGDVAYLSNVAPQALASALLHALAARFKRICIARTTSRADGLRIAYAHPERLGVDRFLAMLGARTLEDGPLLLVGVGTALTIDVVDADGLHRGGRIAPSPTLMREALHARAAHLSPSGGAYVELADDTDDALASGCEGAALALVERSLFHAQRLMGVRARILLHGGGSDALLPHLPDARWSPHLVLEGLARWASLECTR